MIQVIVALAKFPPGSTRGELAFNVLFGTQVYEGGADMPPGQVRGWHFLG